MTSIDILAHEPDDQLPRDLETRICRARELLLAGGDAIAEEVDGVLVAIQAAMLADTIEGARAA